MEGGGRAKRRLRHPAATTLMREAGRLLRRLPQVGHRRTRHRVARVAWRAGCRPSQRHIGRRVFRHPSLVADDAALGWPRGARPRGTGGRTGELVHLDQDVPERSTRRCMALGASRVQSRVADPDPPPAVRLRPTERTRTRAPSFPLGAPGDARDRASHQEERSCWTSVRFHGQPCLRWPCSLSLGCTSYVRGCGLSGKITSSQSWKTLHPNSAPPSLRHSPVSKTQPVGQIRLRSCMWRYRAAGLPQSPRTTRRKGAAHRLFEGEPSGRWTSTTGSRGGSGSTPRTSPTPSRTPRTAPPPPSPTRPWTRRPPPPTARAGTRTR